MITPWLWFIYCLLFLFLLSQVSTCYTLIDNISKSFGNRGEAGVEISELVLTVRELVMVHQHLWKSRYHLLEYWATELKKTLVITQTQHHWFFHYKLHLNTLYLVLSWYIFVYFYFSVWTKIKIIYLLDDYVCRFLQLEQSKNSLLWWCIL